ncbi:MAG: hypothetical protein DRZ82_04945 [Thermoprotei archaeon]|nr:MAG: hypothetical protein DRZ82_04945 [Thermoprotei archaeon]
MDLLTYWHKLPIAARRYILYHCIITPLLFTWYIVPYLMLEIGLNVAESGILFTVGSALSACLNFVIGRWLDRGCPNILMAIISVLDGFSYLLYYFGFMLRNVSLILAGITVERISFGLYPVYAVYEYEVYPEEIREKAYVYHNVLPFLSQAITYPVIGYVLGVLLPDIRTLINFLLLTAFISFLYALIPIYWLPKAGRSVSFSKRERTICKIPTGLYLIVLVLILIGLSTMLAPPLILVNLFKEVMGGGLFELSIYDAISAMTIIVFSLPLLKVRKERGFLMVILGLFLLCSSNITLAFTKAISFALLASFLASAGYAIMDPFLMDILFSHIPRDRKGTVLGSIAGIRRLLGIISPAIAGILAEKFFPGAPYIISSFLVLISIVIIVLVAKHS